MWEQWQSAIENYTFFSGDSAWMSYVFVTVFLTLLLSQIAGLILRRVESRLERTQNAWDDALVTAIRRPLRAAIWVIGFSIAADFIYQETESPIFEAAGTIREVLLITIIGWTLLRFTNNIAAAIVEHKCKKGEDVDLTTVDAITNLVKASIVITTMLIIMQALGYSINAVLTFGGIGGIAIGFAAQDLLANFFGAMMIYMDRPFNVGDWIRSPDRNIEGTVKKIGWRMTTIHTFDKRPLYVPNSVFTQISVENPSRMSHRRIKETVGIRYDDIGQMQTITEQVKDMLKNHEAIDEAQTLMVNFDAFNSSSCDFFIYTFTHTTVWTEFHEIKQDVLLKIADIVAKNGAEIAFPTRTLHMVPPDVDSPKAA